jgi:hypothetical protein
MSTWRQRQAKKEEAERNKDIELNEINFPSLSSDGWSTQEKKKKQFPAKSFASLAVEWNQHTEEEKQREELEKEQRRIEEHELEVLRKIRNRGMYAFGTSHAREEDTYYESDNQEDRYEEPETADNSENWRTVSKPVRKPKNTFENVMFRAPTLPPPEEQDSVWNTYEE